jgi:hypothetical protein
MFSIFQLRFLDSNQAVTIVGVKRRFGKGKQATLALRGF